jgi:hypothetical protein
MKTMRLNNHTDFILSPITDILRDVISASAGIGSGIETFPLCDYVMQSAFLKMTGFQEQKMKCICWELATNDYEYRYEFTRNPLGECSSYKDKQAIYKDLIKQIIKQIGTFDASTDIKKADILRSTTLDIKDLFWDTNLSIWTQNSFNEYHSIWKEVKQNHFANENTTLFTAIRNGISLKKMYEEHLYKHRNRCAHNTLSYQQNLPTLKTLVSEEYRYENYFIYFSILVLIDKVFIELYNKYLHSIEDN